MKTSTPTLITLAALLALAVNLHSQGIAPKTPLDQLKALKAKNIELLETQKATLLKLDEMDKQAEQMRFFSKRS
jgi:hypothetical protein